MISQRLLRHFRRAIAPPVALIFSWSFCFGPAVQAATYRAPRHPGRVRSLLPAEMRRISGSQTGGGTSTAPVEKDTGAPYPWNGQSNGTNTWNGNKLISLPLVSWTAKGGLPVAFTLNHNSKSTYNGALGQKWTHTYDIWMTLDSANSRLWAHWGDGQEYAFAVTLTGFTPPAGIHDTVTQSGYNYDLVTKDQVTYHYVGASGSAVAYCASITDANGNSVTINRDTAHKVTTVVDPTSRTVTLGYDSNNRVNSVTDPLSRSWSISYNGNGELTQVSWPVLGSTTYTDQFAYDTGGHHDIVTHTDRRGHNWTYTYTTSDNLATASDPLSNQTSYTYSSGSTVVTDPNSNTETDYYDSSGHVTSHTDANSNTEYYSYDGDNNRTQVTDKRGKVWQYGFDGSGNRTSATDPLSHTTYYTYNSKNRPLTVTDPLGHYVSNTYDSTLNWRLMQTDEMTSSTGTTLATTTYTYNTDGTVATKADANSHQTTYGYDTDGNLNSVTTPNSRVTGWSYNGLGVKTSRTDALSRTTSYTLDNWLRTTTTTYPNSSTKTFSYDACGNLTGWTDGAGTWSRTYDNANRLTAEALNSTTRFSYTYDGTGQLGLLSSMTDAASRTFTYSYTNANQLSSVAEADGMTTLTTSYTYDAAGNETGITNPNSTTVAKAYDDAGRLTSVTNANSSATTLSSFSYGYNDDNQRTSLSEADGSAVSYGYDAQHHLTSESRTGTNPYSKSYTVDGVGNRTAQTVGGTSTSFTLNSDDELSSTSGGFSNSYSYNANGEQTGRTLSGTSYTLTYDYDGQLTSISTGGSTTASFTYDALGRRYSRAASGTTTQFLSAPVDSHIYLEGVGSTVTAKYGYGNALIHKDGEYPLFDGQGSERTVTIGIQTVTGSINYDAFGVTVGTSGSSSSAYMYGATSGYRTDAGDAGLTHVSARYYDAQVGRFVSRDTKLTERPFLYCGHDPEDNCDPTGHIGLPYIAVTPDLGVDIWVTTPATAPGRSITGGPVYTPVLPGTVWEWPISGTSGPLWPLPPIYNGPTARVDVTIYLRLSVAIGWL